MQCASRVARRDARRERRQAGPPSTAALSSPRAPHLTAPPRPRRRRLQRPGAGGREVRGHDQRLRRPRHDQRHRCVLLPGHHQLDLGEVLRDRLRLHPRQRRHRLLRLAVHRQLVGRQDRGRAPRRLPVLPLRRGRAGAGDDHDRQRRHPRGGRPPLRRRRRVHRRADRRHHRQQGEDVGGRRRGGHRQDPDRLHRPLLLGGQRRLEHPDARQPAVGRPLHHRLPVGALALVRLDLLAEQRLGEHRRHLRRRRHRLLQRRPRRPGGLRRRVHRGVRRRRLHRGGERHLLRRGLRLPLHPRRRAHHGRARDLRHPRRQRRLPALRGHRRLRRHAGLDAHHRERGAGELRHLGAHLR